MIRERHIDPEDLNKKNRSEMKISDHIFTVTNRENPF
jgi:hypothetical protein